MSETIRAKVAKRRFVDVPALKLLGQWALHGTVIKPYDRTKPLYVSSHSYTVTHVPSARVALLGEWMPGAAGSC